VNVTDTLGVPLEGTDEGKVKAKDPVKGTPPTPVAEPPLSVEDDNACPRKMGEAVGFVAMVGVALAITQEPLVGAL